MKLNIFSYFEFNLDCTEALFYKSRINIHGVYVTNKKKLRKVSFKSKKRICITVNSNFNSIETNNSNTSNSNNVMENSNLLSINAHTKSSLNKLIN